MTDDVPLYFILLIIAAIVIIFLILKLKKKEDNPEEEIISIVNESTQKGELRQSEATMIHNIFEFDDKDVKDIMVHRGDIVALDAKESFKNAVDLFISNNFSRFPVFKNDLDNIIGVIHMRDLFELSLEKVNFAKKIEDFEYIMKKPVFVPETHSINTLLTMMQLNKTHLVLIKDEYGQTSGLISMEDILEEIVGNIFDEYDTEEESIISKKDGTYIMFGRTQLEDIAQCLSIEFDTEDIETLNGFLLKEIGRIPKQEDQIEIKYMDYIFRILNVKGNMIQAVKVAYSGE